MTETAATAISRQPFDDLPDALREEISQAAGPSRCNGAAEEGAAP